MEKHRYVQIIRLFNNQRSHWSKDIVAATDYDLHIRRDITYQGCF